MEGEKVFEESASSKETSVAVPDPTPQRPVSPVSLDHNTVEKGPEPTPEVAPVPEAPPRTATGIRWALIVVSILSSTFLFALDNTITADVQPQIVHRFNSIDKLPWLAVSFFLGGTSTNLFWGKMYGLFDAKWLYLFTVTIFEVGSALTGGAPNMSALIVGRAIAGFGGSGMYCGVMTLLAVNTTEHERPTYIGLTGVTWGLGTVLGPIIGGAFADGPSWRWGFYINLLSFAACAPVYVFLIESFDPRRGTPLSRRFREIDWAGTILFIGAFLSIVMAVSFGGSVYRWGSGQIVALFVLSPVLFTLFALQQGFEIFTTASRRIFPVSFLKSRTMLTLFVVHASASCSTFSSIYFIPLFFQFAHGDDALEAGVRLLPLVAMLIFFCVANGAIMSATGYYMPWYLFGSSCVVISSALLHSTVNLFSSTSKLYGYTALLGIGCGSYVQASYSVAQASVRPEQIPESIGFLTLAQLGGGTLGLDIANAVFLNESRDKLTHLLPNVPKSEINAAIAGVGSTLFQSLDPATREKVLAIIVDSIGKVWIIVLTGGAVALVLSLTMKREKLFIAAGAAA